MFNQSLNILISLVPFLWRRPKHLAWIKTGVGGLQALRDWLIVNRAANLRVLQFSASRIYLQHKLNDDFDPINRQILIQNNIPINPQYVYNAAENIEMFMYNSDEFNDSFLSNSTEIFASSGFTVIIPVAINLSDVFKLQVSRVVDVYNMATTNYSIIQQ